MKCCVIKCYVLVLINKCERASIIIGVNKTKIKNQIVDSDILNYIDSEWLG